MLKNPFFIAVVITIYLCTSLLSGCGSSISPQMIEAAKNWVQPVKPTYPENDIPPVDSNFQCTGTWACQEQFASIVKARIAKGELTLDHNQAFVAEMRNDVISMSGLRMEHANFTGAIIEKHGNGTPVHYVMRNRRGAGRFHRFNNAVPSSPFPVIINHSMKTLSRNFGLSDLNFIFVQITGNGNSPEHETCVKVRIQSECESRLDHIASSGRLIMVGTFPRHRRSKCGSFKHHCIIASARGVPFDFEGKELYTGTSGTSWAAPQVSAALQLLSTMWPYLTQEQLVELLLDLAEDRGDPGTDNVFGRGVLSFEKLFDAQGFKGFKCNEIECVDTNSYS